MSSTGTTFEFDNGYLKQGVTLGTEHCYLKDGIWVRCDCGCEIMEFIMCDFDDPKGYDYQIRCFGGHVMSKEDTWHSCVQVKKENLEFFIQVLESRCPSCKVEDLENPNYFLQVVRDEDYGEVTITLYRRKKRRRDRYLWEIIIKQKDATTFAKRIKEMIKRDINDHKVEQGENNG